MSDISITQEIIKTQKAELHAHINGSVPLEFLFKLVDSSNSFTKEEKIFFSTRPKGWEESFKRFSYVYRVINNKNSLYKAIKAIAFKFYQDGVRHLELRTTLKESKDKEFTFESYLRTVLEAIDDLAKEEESPKINLIISFDRGKSLEFADKTIEVLLRNKSHHVVGVDLCGDPFSSRFIDFSSYLDKARSLGYKVTLHCGEIKNDLEVFQMLRFIPDRISHACHLNNDHLRLLIDLKIPVEICLSSNLRTQVIKNLDEHIITTLYNSNHPFSICTDDQGIFHTDINEEYKLAINALDLNQDKFKTLCKRSFELCF